MRVPVHGVMQRDLVIGSRRTYVNVEVVCRADDIDRFLCDSDQFSENDQRGVIRIWHDDHGGYQSLRIVGVKQREFLYFLCPQQLRRRFIQLLVGFLYLYDRLRCIFCAVCPGL